MERIKRIFQNWMVTVSKFAKPFCESSDTDETDVESHVDVVAQMHALRRYHLSSCVQSTPQADEVPRTIARPLPEKNLRSHWFEYDPMLHIQSEHDGKKIKVSSDTWNRLDSAMTKISEKVNQQGAVPYSERGRRPPKDVC